MRDVRAAAAVLLAEFPPIQRPYPHSEVPRCAIGMVKAMNSAYEHDYEYGVLDTDAYKMLRAALHYVAANGASRANSGTDTTDNGQHRPALNE